MSSTWVRIVGEGQPTDYSAGASTEGDYTGPRLVPAIQTPSERTEPVEAVPDALGRSSIYPQPTPVEHEPVDTATGWRLLVKFIRSRQETP
ncbi:MAG TPA: hypothetical protein VGQ85_05570 [Candidatus Limnocylindrales bacterium]|nr:hypothetical protein [Candidatus Limnocylindrales bacterium]